MYKIRKKGRQRLQVSIPWSRVKLWSGIWTKFTSTEWGHLSGFMAQSTSHALSRPLWKTYNKVKVIRLEARSSQTWFKWLEIKELAISFVDALQRQTPKKRRNKKSDMELMTLTNTTVQTRILFLVKDLVDADTQSSGEQEFISCMRTSNATGRSRTGMYSSCQSCSSKQTHKS